MKTILRIAAVAIDLVVMLIADVPLLPVQLVPEAQAILGVRRRTAVVVGATVHAADSAQMAQAQQQAAAEKEAAAAGTPLPLGTVVAALPPGCVATPVVRDASSCWSVGCALPGRGKQQYRPVTAKT
jgi:hypothetical protein